MDKLYADLKVVQDAWYDRELVKGFVLEKYSFAILMDELLKDKQKFENREALVKYMTEALHQPEIFKKFLTDEDPAHQDRLANLILAKNDEVRGLVMHGISCHIEMFYEYIDSVRKQNPASPVVEIWLKVLFHFLADSETPIGLKAVKVLNVVTRLSGKNEGNYWIWYDKTTIEFAGKTLQHYDDVVKCRAMELVIEISNLDENLWRHLKECGLFDAAVKIYKTADLLLKLAAVEVIQKLGDSSWNAKYFAESTLLKEVLSEAFDPNGEYYVRKNLSSLVAKLVARGTIKFTETIKKNFMGQLQMFLSGGYKEENEGGIEIVGYLGLTMEGLQLLIDRGETVLKPFLRFAASTDNSIKKKFLSAYTIIMQKPPVTGRDASKLAYLFYLLGFAVAPDAGFSWKYNEDIEYDKNLNNAFQFLFAHLLVPFPDIEYQALCLLSDVINQEFGVREFVKQSKSLEYLVKQHSKSKETFDLKNEIRDKILFAPYPFRTEAWFSHFVSTMKEMHEAQKATNQMQVATEVQ